MIKALSYLLLSVAAGLVAILFVEMLSVGPAIFLMPLAPLASGAILIVLPGIFQKSWSNWLGISCRMIGMVFLGLGFLVCVAVVIGGSA